VAACGVAIGSRLSEPSVMESAGRSTGGRGARASTGAERRVGRKGMHREREGRASHFVFWVSGSEFLIGESSGVAQQNLSKFCPVLCPSQSNINDAPIKIFVGARLPKFVLASYTTCVVVYRLAIQCRCTTKFMSKFRPVLFPSQILMMPNQICVEGSCFEICFGQLHEFVQTYQSKWSTL
jgi:hypothetical protein